VLHTGPEFTPVKLIDKQFTGETTKSGFQVSWRWGASPQACQIRITASAVTPASRAIVSTNYASGTLGHCAQLDGAL
jgi:hypothetical protein